MNDRTGACKHFHAHHVASSVEAGSVPGKAAKAVRACVNLQRRRGRFFASFFRHQAQRQTPKRRVQSQALSLPCLAARNFALLTSRCAVDFVGPREKAVRAADGMVCVKHRD